MSRLDSEIAISCFAMINEFDIADVIFQLLGFYGNRVPTLVVGQDGQLLVYTAGRSPGTTLGCAFSIFSHLSGNTLMDLVRAIGAEVLADCLRRAEPTCILSNLTKCNRCQQRAKEPTECAISVTRASTKQSAAGAQECVAACTLCCTGACAHACPP